MLKSFKEHIDLKFPEISKVKVYLAISGGVDSVVLLNLLLRLKISPALLHCNYSLREEESDVDEGFIRQLAAQHNLALEVSHFNTVQEAESRNLTIQETARNLRYEWFAEVMKKPSILLTAHHLDDRIETFYINILRGTGIKGLQSIPAERGHVIRPLLIFTKKEILEYAKENRLQWREDSSNQNDKYLRNRIRTKLIPLLDSLGDGGHSKMKNLFTELENVNTYLEKLSREWLNVNFENQSCSIQTYFNLDSVLQERVFRNHGIYRKNLDEFLHFLNGSKGSLFLTKEFAFTHDQASIFIQKKRTRKAINTLVTAEGIKIEQGFREIIIQKTDLVELNLSDGVQQLCATKLKPSFHLRNWKIGDRIQPLGMKGSKLVSKILIEAKLNSFDKKEVLVIEAENGKLASILGLCIAEDFKLSESSTSSWEIKLHANLS